MPCTSPITGYRYDDGSVRFVERAGVHSTVTVSCGRCVSCRLERSRVWAVRCVHEASQHEQNSFVTLTYSDECLPAGGTLRYSDFQWFMKRLRKTGRKVRFFVCGEYGDDTRRPHFHALLFGVWFEDAERFGGSEDHPLWRSNELDALWKNGHALIGRVSFESAAYVSRYVMKKVLGDGASAHYRSVDVESGEVHELVPEFVRCSLRPGIGATWLDRFYKEIFPSGKVVSRGKEVNAPKYYLRRFDRLYSATGDEVAGVVADRYRDGLSKAEDNTEERLAVKDAVVKARVKLLKRGSI